MSMFDNYQNLDKDLDINNPYAKDILLHERPHMPLEMYNINNELIGFGWNQGDPIVLEFVVTGQVMYDDGTYVDAETYLKNKNYQFELFNFRYEKVFETITNSNNIIDINIGSELSAKLYKGMYYGKLTLLDKDNKVSQTLADNDVCKFYVG